MPELARFWRTLDGFGALAGVEAEWREHLGDELEYVRPFLRVGELAEGYPCPSPGGDGCPRRIVQHEDCIVAVCGEESSRCDRLELTRDQAVILELDRPKLAKEIARMLGLQGASGEAVQGWHDLLDLGSLGLAANKKVAAVLALGLGCGESVNVERFARSRGSRPTVVVTPTERHHSTLAARVDRMHRLLACSELIKWKQGLIACEPLQEVIRRMVDGNADRELSRALTAPRRRGRPEKKQKLDPARVRSMWKSGGHESKAALANYLKVSPEELERLLDVQRKREKKGSE